MAPSTGGRGAETLALALLTGGVVLLCGLPLALVAQVGLTADGAFSLAPLTEAIGSRSVQRALWNSIDSAAVSAALSLVVGAALAVAVGLTDLRRKGPLTFLILLPMMIPPHVTAIAWIQALGPGSAALGALGLAPPIGSTHPLYSREGVIALLAAQHAPLCFLVLRASLRALPRDLSEAARVSGAGPWRMLRTVVGPLTAPALIAAFALAFVSALGNFGIPALLGAPARYTTLPVLIWRRLASFGPSALADMAVLATLVAAAAALAVAAQMALQRRAAAPLIGPPQPALALRLGPWRGPLEAGVWALLAALLGLPMASLVATALVPTYGVPLSAETVTLANFHEVLVAQTVTLRAFANSTLAAGAAAASTAVIAIGLAHFLARRRGAARRAAGAAAMAAELAYAVPGVVISVAFILAFIRPVLGVSLYGSLTLIGLAYVAAFLAVALKPAAAAAAAQDPALDDAARVSGAGFLMRMARIHAPLALPAAMSGAVLVFLTAYNEITVSALLWSQGSETIGTTIFNYEDGGYTTLAAAMAAVTVALTAALMLALDRLSRGLPEGAAPWRA
ncbi:ABC transporter permease [Rubrimonas cliftonensis]|uniref:Iron(III) transport system permease protein n=1 Tax=Rubrimonas cliftonensis TaxID=89524 RepID=A0A1H3YLF4_9RHOB|nr:ABC transporter permease subunit [Rubrimonas cliftonensis]SEA11864.1 iron(III) transport system permease protein [Rubrimonas cliftonensis]